MCRRWEDKPPLQDKNKNQVNDGHRIFCVHFGVWFWMHLLFCMIYSNHLRKSLQLRKLQTVLISQQRCTSVQQHTLWLERLMEPHLEASIQLMTKTENKQSRFVCTRQIWPPLSTPWPYQRSNAAGLRWYHIGPLAALSGNKHSKACKLLLDVSLLPRDRRHKNMLWSQRTAYRRDYHKTILLTFHMTVQALCQTMWQLTRKP